MRIRTFDLEAFRARVRRVDDDQLKRNCILEKPGVENKGDLIHTLVWDIKVREDNPSVEGVRVFV